MIRRPRRSTPAIIVAALLLAVCVLVVVAVVQSLLGQTPFLTLAQLLSITSSQRWSSAATITAAIVLALLGLVLLVAALRPGKPTVLPLGRLQYPNGDPGADAGVRRHTLVKDLTATAESIAGVTAADLSARRHSVTARVRIAAADPTAVRGQVHDRLEARIAQIGPATRLKVRVDGRAAKNT